MRYAVVSDLHANWQAWNAVLQDMREHQVDSVVCLGDVVGYGPRPEEVLTGVRQCTPNIVIGNHDAAACGLLDAGFFNEHARIVVEWTTQHLSEDSLAFLRRVPLTIETEEILFVHAEVAQPGRFGYIDSEEKALHQFMFTDAAIVFVGHTHKPLAYSYNKDSIRTLTDRDFHLAPGHRYLINTGSVGEPRTIDDVRASYVIYDSNSRALYFRKVMFDVEAYRRDLVETGLKIEPYFLRMIDHEASQGRNVFDLVDDCIMAVPEKSTFKGLSKGVYLAESPPAKSAAASGGAGALVENDLYYEPTTPSPVGGEPLLQTPPTSRGRSLPKPTAPHNFGARFILILAAILIGLAAGFWVLFKL